MESIYGGLNKVYIWIYRLMIANILWIYFSFYGLLVAGIFPSTCAMFAICRKWIRKEDFNIYDTYKYYFKKDFKNANILGWVMLAIVAVLTLDYIYFSAISKSYSLYISYLFILLMIFSMIASLVMYSIYNHYEMSIKDNVKYTILYPFSNLLISLLLLIGLCLIVYVLYIVMPVLSLFFGTSLPILYIVLITNISLNAITKKQIQLQYQY